MPLTARLLYEFKKPLWLWAG